MSHTSQETKAEYGNRHETNITSKMANIWERKIGSDKEHKPSPTTVVKQSSEKIERIQPLTKVASRNTSTQLHKKNTMEIVEDFERMASNNDSLATKLPSKAGVSALDKLDKQRSMKVETNGELKKMVERISRQMDDISDAVALLKSKIDAL